MRTTYQTALLFALFATGIGCGGGQEGGGDSDENCEPNAYQACDPNGNVFWFDSCDVEGDIFKKCPKMHAECFAKSDVEADCRCVNKWEGSDCEVCPGRWDPRQDCDNCVNGWDRNTDCTACLPNWSGDDCTTCRFYAKAGASSSGANGLTWETAYPDLQQAIDAASSAAAPAGPSALCEVWVAQGTYYAYKTKPEDTVQLKSGAALIGGFKGDETDKANRDSKANPTAIDGRKGPDSSSLVYYAVAGANNSMLDGFIITGAGMYNDKASPVVANCIFAGTSSGADGGGMYNADNEPIIVNTIFSGASAANYGGGIYNKNSIPAILNCIFAGSAATIGGAIYNLGSSPLVVNSVFAGNNATIGGGIYNKDVSLESIVNSTFFGNDSANSGGGIKNINSTPTLRNSILFDNAPDAISNDDMSSCDVAYCDIQGDAVFPGVENKTDDPLFADVAAGSGSWSDVSFDQATFRTTLTDADGAWTDDQLVGLFVKPSADDPRIFIIEGNTADTVYLLGDMTGMVSSGDSYRIFDLRLGAGSPCVDSGDSGALPLDQFDLDSDSDTEESVPLDLDGKERIKDGKVDIGSYERQG